MPWKTNKQTNKQTQKKEKLFFDCDFAALFSYVCSIGRYLLRIDQTIDQLKRFFFCLAAFLFENLMEVKLRRYFCFGYVNFKA